MSVVLSYHALFLCKCSSTVEQEPPKLLIVVQFHSLAYNNNSTNIWEGNMTREIGMKRILKSDCGWAVFTLCPMNTSNPQPTNAFWQQTSKYYTSIGRCQKYTGVIL